MQNWYIITLINCYPSSYIWSRRYYVPNVNTPPNTGCSVDDLKLPWNHWALHLQAHSFQTSSSLVEIRGSWRCSDAFEKGVAVWAVNVSSAVLSCDLGGTLRPHFNQIQLSPITPHAMPTTLRFFFRMSNTAYYHKEIFQAVVAPARIWVLLV